MQVNNKNVLSLVLALAGVAGSVHAQQAPAPAPAAEEEASFTVTGFVVEGANPLAESVTQATLAPFTGKHTGVERLQQAASALEAELRTSGYGFYRVVLPPQDIGGVIKLQMLRFTLGTVTIKGNQFFSNENILRSLPQLEAGGTPNTYQLARDLSVANENPSKRTGVSFKQGSVEDTIDANVEVADSKTLTGFLAANNTGNSSTGYGRLTAGVMHTNLFDRDQQGTITYTTSPSDPGRVHQYGGFYRAPVYQWGGVVSAYYSRSSVTSGVVANTIDITGRGEFIGAQYTQYFAPRGDYRDYLMVGLDDKNFDDITSGASVLAPSYRTRPITISYTGRIEKKWGLWGFNFDYARNLSLGGGFDRADYNANRQGASTDWSALRMGLDLTMPFATNWTFNGRVRSQFSGSELVPGEQFGIGGAQSIRGLPERILAGDSGVQGSAEFWTPALAENTRGILFFDFGDIYRHNDAVTPRATITSLGGGLRWTLGTSLSANLDIGHVLSGMGKLPAGTSRDKVHLSMLWRF